MMLFAAVLSLTSLLVAEVAAHGAVTSYIIDGKAYPGYADILTMLELTELGLIVLLVTKDSLLLQVHRPSNGNGLAMILFSS